VLAGNVSARRKLEVGHRAAHDQAAAFRPPEET
jgi:hypothetical protein